MQPNPTPMNLIPQGMTRDEAVDRLVRMRERKRRQIEEGYARKKVREILADKRSLDQSWAAANAAKMDASHALDLEALTVALVTMHSPVLPPDRASANCRRCGDPLWTPQEITSTLCNTCVANRQASRQMVSAEMGGGR